MQQLIVSFVDRSLYLSRFSRYLITPRDVNFVLLEGPRAEIFFQLPYLRKPLLFQRSSDVLACKKLPGHDIKV